MHRLPIIVAVAVLTAALLPGAATAKLPRPRTTLIVPGKSIAGVKLLMTERQVRRQWGRGARCTRIPAVGNMKKTASCDWRGGSAATAASARVTFTGGRVYLVSITTARSATTFRPRGRHFARWKTRRGIRIGSRMRSVRRAYPRVTGSGELELIGRRSITAFLGKARVESISLRLRT